MTWTERMPGPGIVRFMIAGHGAEDAGGDVVFLADRDQAMALDEVQGTRAGSTTSMGCQHVRKHVSEQGLAPPWL